MNIIKPVMGAVAVAAIGTFAASTASVAMEKTLNSVTSLQQTNVLAKAFIVKFVAVLNK